VIGAGATLLAQQSKPSPAPAQPSATTQPGTATPEPPETTAAAYTGIHWQGTFVLDNYVDFDSTPPKNQSGGLSQDVKQHRQL
jgi:hypothetical protein